MSLSGEEQKAPMSLETPPRVSRLRAAVVVCCGLVVVSALTGVLWVWLAPGVRAVVALTRSGQRVHVFLGNEADHFFTAAFLFVGLLSVVAAVAAVLVWQWRSHRGPVLAGALAVGAVAGAAAAAGVGTAIAHARYGSVDIAAAPISPEHRVHYVVEAASAFFGHSPLQISATLLFPAAVATLVYALIAVSTAHDDLGAWPPEPVVGYGRPASGAIGPGPTVDGAQPVVPSPPAQ